MSVVTPATAPLVIFGDLDADLWGIVVGGERPRVAVARLTGADVELRPADLDTSDDDVWTLIGSGCDLRLERADATAATETPDGERGLEPCRVSGSVEFEDSRHEFDEGGIRTSTSAASGAESQRLFAAWFPAGHEIAALSSRPNGAKGHDRDGIAVVARGEEHPLVFDPRLSTTYDGAGVPQRVGLELWLGDEPDGDLWPRRVAGGSTGSSVAGSDVAAYAFECVSRGEPGAGVYLLQPPSAG